MNLGDASEKLCSLISTLDFEVDESPSSIARKILDKGKNELVIEYLISQFDCLSLPFSEFREQFEKMDEKKRKILSSCLSSFVVACFYVFSYRTIGKEIANWIPLTSGFDWNSINHILGCCWFFADKIEAKSKQFTPNLPSTNLFPCNPWIGYWKNSLLLGCRTVNYTQERARGNSYYIWDKSQLILTRNFLLFLDSKQNISSQLEILDQSNIPSFLSSVRGFEDCRYFSRKDNLYFSATRLDILPNRIPRIVIGKVEISSDSAIVTKSWHCLIENEEIKQEKNWLPFVVEDSIYFFY
jgi:hypothetical protein